MIATNKLFSFLLVLFCLSVPNGVLGGRMLKDCTSEAVSSASSYTKDVISKAVSDAFAQCKSCPCENEANSAAESVAQAVARAMATTTLSVKGTRT
jgi:hypothetical protein